MLWKREVGAWLFSRDRNTLEKRTQAPKVRDIPRHAEQAQPAAVSVDPLLSLGPA
jgi:hypothetical protein